MEIKGILKAEIHGYLHNFVIDYTIKAEGEFLVGEIQIGGPTIPGTQMTHALSILVKSANPESPMFAFVINPLIKNKYGDEIVVDGTREVPFKQIELEDMSDN